MLKEQVLFGGSVVGVFRVDMFECCQPRHLLSLDFILEGGKVGYGGAYLADNA